MPTTRSQGTAVPSCAGRKRAAMEAIQPAKTSKKRKMRPSADETYLQQAIEEFGKQRGYPKRVQRRAILEAALGYFRRSEMPGVADTHSPQSMEEARRLLASDEPIRRPVFVRDGANWSMIDRTDDRRPIEQLFDFLHDPSEEGEYKDEAASTSSNLRIMPLREIKQLFLEHDRKAPRFPRNFPDLVNPMLDHGIPQFMQSAKCTLLHDILRRQLDCAPKDICDCDDDGEESGHCGHRIKRAQYLNLQQMWRYWQGTVMLAEPGAVTYPHWDKYSTSTWISCIEGEIGFGWLAEPSEQEKTSWLDDVPEPKGRWLFKVLRPGDAVYMPPGTVHLVFRRPGGGQTMGFASQMLRRGDTIAWLQYLKIELEFAVQDELADAPYAEIVPGLVNGLLHLVNSACREGDFDRFGGKPKIREILEVIEGITELMDELPEPKK